MCSDNVQSFLLGVSVYKSSFILKTHLLRQELRLKYPQVIVSPRQEFQTHYCLITPCKEQ